MQKTKLVPPVYFVMTLILMGVLHVLFPIARFLGPPATFSGLVFVIGGFVISAYAAGLFRRAGTPVIPFERSTTLITTGIYRHTRNPMYLGLVVILIGVVIVCGTLSPILPIPFFVWVIRRRFVLQEERFLEGIFGQQYLDYKKSVRRWI